MINLSELIACMPQEPIQNLFYNGRCGVSHGIYLLEAATVLAPNCVYVGTPSVILPFLAGNYDFIVTFISSGTHAGYGDDVYPEKNLCITDVPLATLYNDLNGTLMRFLNLHGDFSDAGNRGDAAKSIVQIISDYLPGAAVYLLDSGLNLAAQNRLIAEKQGGFSPFAKKIDSVLNTAGSLDGENIREIEEKRTARGNPHCVFFNRLAGAKKSPYYLLLFFPEDQVIRPITGQLIHQIYAELTDCFARQGMAPLGTPEMEVFVQALMERKVKTKNEVKNRLAALGAPRFKYVICAVVEFEFPQPHLLVDCFVKDMKKIFPEATCSSYQGDLIFFIPAERSGEFLTYEQAPMDDLLIGYNAYMGLPFPIRSLLSLPVMYWDSKNAIFCGRQYDKAGDKRVFCTKDFVFEKIISLCACPANKEKTNGNLGYLCSPSIIALLRYDYKHGTNYTKTLEEYVNSGENIAECARRMFIHRNTLVTKLAKIKEITGGDLGDAYFMHTLFFGFQVYHYITQVQGKNLLTELDK